MFFFFKPNLRGKFKRESKCTRHRTLKVKIRFQYKSVKIQSEKFMRKDSGNLIFSIFSHSSRFPPKYSLSDLCNLSQPVFPSTDPHLFIPLTLNLSITPFFMPLFLYLSSHFSSVHPHIHLNQGSRCV